MSFEGSLKRLEDIVKELERGGASLDHALKLYEEGVKLSRACSAQLEQVQQRIEMLVKEVDGAPRSQPFHASSKGSDQATLNLG